MRYKKVYTPHLYLKHLYIILTLGLVFQGIIALRKRGQIKMAVKTTTIQRAGLATLSLYVRGS